MLTSSWPLMMSALTRSMLTKSMVKLGPRPGGVHMSAALSHWPVGPACQVWLKEKEKGQGGVNELKKIGPARWPIRFGLVAQENGWLGTQLGELARAAARKGGSRTGPTGYGQPITSSPPLLFFAGSFLGRRGTSGPFLLPSLLIFTGEPGPHGSASFSSSCFSRLLRRAWKGRTVKDGDCAVAR